MTWSRLGRSLSVRRPERWVLVLPLALLLLTLGAAAFGDSSRPVWLGLTTRWDDGVTVVNWVQPGGWAWDAGIRPGDHLIAVDDAVLSANTRDSQVASAQSVDAISASTGETLHAPNASSAAPKSPLERLSFGAIAGSFALLGFAVFVLATDVAAATVMLWFCTTAAMTLVDGVATASGSPLAIGGEMIALVLFSTSALWMFLIFPRNRLGARWPRVAAFTSLALAAAVSLGYLGSALIAPIWYEFVRPAVMLVAAVDLLGAMAAIVASLVAAFRGPDRPEQRVIRRAMVTVTLGAGAGFGPFCLLALVPLALNVPPLVPAYMAIASIVVLPLSISVVLLSRQFLGIERIVRRGLVALVVWVVLLAVYTLCVESIVEYLQQFPQELQRTALLLALAAAVSSFWPLQRIIRERTEIWLFRDVYNFKHTVQSLGSELAVLPGASAVADHALARLGETLDLRWAVLRIYSPAGEHRWQRRLEIPNGEPALQVPLLADGEALGELVLGPKDLDVELTVQDEALVVSVAPFIAAAIHGRLLFTRLQEQVDLLADREQSLAGLSARLMRVQEEERRSLALELHDDPLQRALLLSRRLGASGLEAESGAAEDVALALRAICYGLRPPMLDDLGLVAALERLVSDVAARSEVEVAFHVIGERTLERVGSELSLALYRVAQEALNNVLKHAHAHNAVLEIEPGDDWLELRVEDDGAGAPTDYTSTMSLGIVGMRERILPWSGELTIGPRAAGGTLLVARVRIAAAEPAVEPEAYAA